VTVAAAAGDSGEGTPGGGAPPSPPSPPPLLLSGDHLPAPFVKPPSAAAVRLVCALLPSVLPPVLHSLSDWKVSRRLATVAMLQALFVCVRACVALLFRACLRVL
jgi:hypothetical protein